MLIERSSSSIRSIVGYIAKDVDDFYKATYKDFIETMPKNNNSGLSKHGFEVVSVRTEPKIGRNAPCYCGSGKKYKKCCIKK